MTEIKKDDCYRWWPKKCPDPDKFRKEYLYEWPKGGGN